MIAGVILGSITLGVLPSIAWLVFFLYEDEDREPRKYIALTFTLGIAFAFLILLVQVFLQDIFAAAGIDATLSNIRLNSLAGAGSLFLVLVAFAATEEVGKFLAARIAVRNNPDFDLPVDAMIYMVTAALGFALVENLGVVGGIAAQTASLTEMLGTISFRFVGATLLHALTSSLVGYYWAKSIRAFGQTRILIFGIAAASLLHAVFNYLILTYGANIYPLAFLLLMGFLVIADFEELKKEKV